jgi:hypothetical protein
MTDQGEATGRAPVQLVRAADPPGEARALAATLHTEAVIDLPAAEREVRLRVDAGRRALGGDDGADAALLARAEEIRAAAAVDPPISDDKVAELERLASDLTRAARIRERTEARFTENLQAKLAASVGVALHPEAIRAAASAVVDAESTLAGAERALADLGPGPTPATGGPAPATRAAQSDATAPAFGHGDDVIEGDDPILRRPWDDFDEVALDRRRSLTQGLAAFFVLAGLGAVALGLGQPMVAGIGLAVLGVVAGVAVALRGRQTAALPEGPARREPQQPPPRPAPVASLDEDEWLERFVKLDAARDEAEEQVRVARNRWRQLAGPDADPHHPDPVIRAHDPQLAYDERLAQSSPTIRTVAAFHRSAQARWKVLWASVGHDDPPPPDQLGATLDTAGPGRASSPRGRESPRRSPRDRPAPAGAGRAEELGGGGSPRPAALVRAARGPGDPGRTGRADG